MNTSLSHHSKIGSYLAWQREFHQRRAHKTSPAQSSRSTMHKFWPALPHSQHILFIVRLRQKWHDMDMVHDLCFVSPPCSTSCDRATPYVNGAAFAVPVSNSALEGSFRFADIVKRRQLSHKPNMTKPISLPREETSQNKHQHSAKEWDSRNCKNPSRTGHLPCHGLDLVDNRSINDLQGISNTQVDNRSINDKV